MDQKTKPVIEWEPTAEELDTVIDIGLEDEGEILPSEGMNTEITSTEAEEEAEEENPSDEQVEEIL